MELARRSPFGGPMVGERGATTQRTIIAAALDIFGEHGFHATSVELITERAGCSRPAFYQYFSSKDDVFWHLARDLVSTIRVLAGGLGEVSAEAAGVESVAEWLDTVVDVFVEYSAVFAAFPAAVRGPSDELDDARDISARVGAALMASIDPRRRPTDLPALPSVTVSVELRTIHYWNAGLGGLSRRRFVTGFAQTLHRLFCGPIEGVNVVVRSPGAQSPAASLPVAVPAAQFGEPARRRGRETQERLLAAGVAVLPERGYHETRVADIVERAGVSHGTFYRYFPTKDALFGVLAERTANTLFDLIEHFPDVTDQTALRDWFEQYFESYRINGGVISVWQEIDFAANGLDEYSLAVAIAVFDQLERIAQKRCFGDHAVDAMVLLAIVDRVPYTVHSQRFSDVGDAIDAAMFIVRDGVFGLPVG